jgi:hypothetical protein
LYVVVFFCAGDIAVQAAAQLAILLVPAFADALAGAAIVEAGAAVDDVLQLAMKAL